MDAPLPPPLKLSGISKRWRKAPDAVLDDVALELAPGTTTWVGGRNGVGKTTLLRIAAGLIRPDAGEVHLGDLEAESDPTAFRRQIGFLSAGSSSLYNRLTVAEHLEFWGGVGLSPKGTRGAARAQVAEALELDELLDRRVDRLSMGQRQRARLAGTLLHDPAIILLDEPANSLDGEAVALLVAEVGRRVAAGAALLWCSPTGERESLDFDRRLLLEQGTLRAA